MVATTPAEWLPILAKRLDDRQAELEVRRSYVNGDAPLPEMGRNTRAAWVAFQQKARTNYGGLAAGSLCNRIRAVSVSVGSDETAPALEAARRVWRDNRMPIQVADAVWDAATVGVGYLLCALDDGGAVISAERPEFAIAAPDPLRPWRARAFAKIWRDDDLRLDFALVWANGARQQFMRESYDPRSSLPVRSADGYWEPMSAPVQYQGPVPVVILDWKDPRGFIAPHADVIDRINLGKLQRLVTTAMQAFKQRFIEGGLPQKDDDGNDLDWGRAFEYAPGAIWDLPEGIKVTELSETDIRPLLEGEKSDARDFAAVSGTPISVFIPDSENQSAEGAHNAKDQQISQAQDAIARFKPAVDAIMVLALTAEKVDLAGATVDVQFAKPEHVSLTEKYSAAAQAKAAGESWKSIARNILGYTPEQIAQDEIDRAEEQLATQLALNATAPAVTPNAAVA
jgi:hypothetical protein